MDTLFTSDLDDDRRPRLTARELECLDWVAKGKSATDIGTILGLSSRTVESYLGKACAKLGVRTRIEAVVAAVLQGLIVVEAPPGRLL